MQIRGGKGKGKEGARNPNKETKESKSFLFTQTYNYYVIVL